MVNKVTVDTVIGTIQMDISLRVAKELLGLYEANPVFFYSKDLQEVAKQLKAKIKQLESLGVR